MTAAATLPFRSRIVVCGIATGLRNDAEKSAAWYDAAWREFLKRSA